MRFARGFFSFWYDFIVGDDWRIALMVVVSLVAGIVLLRWELISDRAIPIVCAGLVAIGLVVSVAREKRKVSG